MANYHITPGLNGYTTTAGKQLRAMRKKAESAAEKEKNDKAAERFTKAYLDERPETTQLTGYEIANLHLSER